MTSIGLEDWIYKKERNIHKQRDLTFLVLSLLTKSLQNRRISYLEYQIGIYLSTGVKEIPRYDLEREIHSSKKQKPQHPGFPRGPPPWY